MYENTVLDCVPVPVAIHNCPDHVTAEPVVKYPAPTVLGLSPFQLLLIMPLLDHAITFPPLPTATQIFPFQVTPKPDVENINWLNPIQYIPLMELAKVLPPLPVATHIVPFHAMDVPCVVNVF